MLSDQVVSLIRTWVPVAVGAFLTWLAAATGVVVPDETSTGLTVALVALVSGVYYGVVRLLEEKWPVVGVLLGAPKQPTYDKAA